MCKECFEINKNALDKLNICSLDYDYTCLRRVVRQEVVNRMKDDVLHGSVSEETDKMMSKWAAHSILMSLIEEDSENYDTNTY